MERPSEKQISDGLSMYLSTERTIPSDNLPVCPTISKEQNRSKKSRIAAFPLQNNFQAV